MENHHAVCKHRPAGLQVALVCLSETAPGWENVWRVMSGLTVATIAHSFQQLLPTFNNFKIIYFTKARKGY
jgi:hypothetical protein